jgi:adenylosuccinate synthase
LVALKYAIMLSGVNRLIMMKSDVLSEFDEVKVAVAYKVNGSETNQIPYDLCNETVEPIYKSFKGWSEDLTICRKKADLPQNFLDYIKYLETELALPIHIISVGPDREQTILD